MAVFKVKTELYFGRGEAAGLVPHLKARGLDRCGMVIDGALLSFGMFRDITARLRSELGYLQMLVYDRTGEPTYGYLDSVKDIFRDGKIDCLIGMGGGSVMDIAKGLAVLITNPVTRAVELRGFPELARLPVPVVTVPTIAGSGSEVTYNAVFIDEAERRKLGINTEHNFPLFAVSDPKLTLSAPLKQSVSSALDCMVHSLESFMSVKATFVTRPLSIEGFCHSFRGIQGLLDDPGDIKAREMLMKGSYMAGIALMNSSAGPAGALSYPLGALFDVSHGLAGAFFIRHILRHNISKGYTGLYALYDRIYGIDSLTEEKKSEKIAEDIIGLIDSSDVPVSLSGFGVTVESAGQLAGQFERYCAGSLAFNPVPVSKEDINGFIGDGLRDIKRGDKCRVLR